MRQVLIIHGWSDTSRSFGPLVEFLRANGYQAVPLWLGDYISLDDDVRVVDVAKRLEAVVRDKLANGELVQPFDVIVHSTGGLVAREWISGYYGDDIAGCPAKRLIMLAPANFGSRLASLGKSMVGRIVKGWNNWFHTGTEMLNALELASPYQWRLAEQDLFVPLGRTSAPAIYGNDGIYAFTIVGTHPYASLLRQMVNEDGADGTVRACAANLNVRGVTLDFAADERQPLVTPWKLRHKTDIPLAVLPDRTHGSVIDPEKNDIKSPESYEKRLGQLILRALGCDTPADYQAIATEWSAITEATAALSSDESQREEVLGKDSDPKWFHQYMQVNVRVMDDHGADVGDYFLEFSGPEDERGDRSSLYFHTEVLEHVHVNQLNSAYRCLYVDHTDLMGNYYDAIRGNVTRALFMSLSAAPPGGNVSYFESTRDGAKGTVPLHFETEKKSGPAAQRQIRWLQPNVTHFATIIIPRTPADKVFRMKKA
jgi:pimeloyl-ACP methyl ester carboxylesterase